MDKNEGQSLPVTLGDLFDKSRILILRGGSSVTTVLYPDAKIRSKITGERRHKLPGGTFSIRSVYLVGHGINNSKAFESLPSWVDVGRATSSITVSTWAKPTHLRPAEAARQR